MSHPPLQCVHLSQSCQYYQRRDGGRGQAVSWTLSPDRPVFSGNTSTSPASRSPCPHRYQPIRDQHCSHVTGQQPMKGRYFLIRSIGNHCCSCLSKAALPFGAKCVLTLSPQLPQSTVYSSFGLPPPPKKICWDTIESGESKYRGAMGK